MGKRWTPDDIERLREGWGCTRGGVRILAKRLGRSADGVRVQASKLKLGAWLDSGTYITLNQLMKLVAGSETIYGGTNIHVRYKSLDMPVRWRKVINGKFKVVYIEDFWEWAETRQSCIDFSKFEENALGAEPDWVRAKRRNDQLNRVMLHPKKCKWSALELSTLKAMCANGATYTDLMLVLMRSAAAIRRKIYDLNLSKPKRCAKVSWTAEDHRLLKDMIKGGVSIERCARYMQRSPEAVRGRIRYLKKTGEWR